MASILSVIPPHCLTHHWLQLSSKYHVGLAQMSTHSMDMLEGTLSTMSMFTNLQSVSYVYTANYSLVMRIQVKKMPQCEFSSLNLSSPCSFPPGEATLIRPHPRTPMTYLMMTIALQTCLWHLVAQMWAVVSFSLSVQWWYILTKHLQMHR